MTHRFLKVDFPINPIDGAMVKTAERTVDGQRRYYYAGAGPHRILFVMRNGQPIEALDEPNTYVKALVGWDPGTADFVLPQHAGKQHTKVTVDLLLTLTPEGAAEFARAAGAEVESLAHILANAPRSDKAGGARGVVGRKRLAGGTQARTVTLTPEQWALAEQLGGGENASAGIRRALDEWKAGA
jgi:hypothetical protein